MLIGFLLIWGLLFVVLRYDLKQNNISSIVRATCFTLITYIILDVKFKEYFKEKNKPSDANDTESNDTESNDTESNDTESNSTESNSTGPIDMPDTTTVEENPITTQANSFKKMKDKCNYVKEQQRLTVNSLYQDFKNLKNGNSINDTQINVLQKNFNDLITVMQVGDVCFN